jgi:GNAT superfamily N-acetyltransferase
MVAIKKCQSKKHSTYGGCGDPRCPEGKSIRQAMDKAVQQKDVIAYMEARKLKELPTNSLTFHGGGLVSAMLLDDEGMVEDAVRFVLPRSGAIEYIKELDRKTLPSFATYTELQDYINTTYHPYASISLRQYDGYGPDKNISRISVADMTVDADLRGSGVGSYFRKLLIQHADENGYIISGTPTNSGDRTMEHTNDNTDEFREHAINHRSRLEHFYLRNGYERNYGTRASIYGERDFLTKKKLSHDAEWYSKFNEYGQNLLADAGSFIKWPNNTIPSTLLKASS